MNPIKILAVFIFSLLFSNTVAFAAASLVITNQPTPRVLVAPYANTTVNAGTLIFPFADGITFVGSGGGGTTFRGAIDVILKREGGTLTDILTCTDTSGGYTKSATTLTSVPSDTSLTITLTFASAFTNAAVQTILRSFTYRCYGNSINAQNRTLWIVVRESSADNTEIWPSGSGGNDHYYRYLNTGSDWATYQAVAAADMRYGMAGYLATVTSSAENSRVYGLNSAGGFIGGTRLSGSVYKWLVGPESQAANGGSFPSVNGAGGFDYSYSNWNSGEPSGGIENATSFVSAGSGVWNDIYIGNGNGAYFEYGSQILNRDVNYVNIRVLSPNSLAPAAGF
jgi:hypothetical protein